MQICKVSPTSQTLDFQIAMFINALRNNRGNNKYFVLVPSRKFLLFTIVTKSFIYNLVLQLITIF